MRTTEIIIIKRNLLAVRQVWQLTALLVINVNRDSHALWVRVVTRTRSCQCQCRCPSHCRSSFVMKIRGDMVSVWAPIANWVFPISISSFKCKGNRTCHRHRQLESYKCHILPRSSSSQILWYYYHQYSVMVYIMADKERVIASQIFILSQMQYVTQDKTPRSEKRSTAWKYISIADRCREPRAMRVKRQRTSGGSL